MDIRVKSAIIAIAVIIPITSSSVWISGQPDSVSPIEESSEINALASFYPLYEFTKEVGGDRVKVSLLVPQGVEPHDWGPTINDVEKIQRAKIIVINGVGFEDWLDNIKELNSDVIIVDSSVGVEVLEFSSMDHDEHEQDHDEHEQDHDEHEQDHDEHEQDHGDQVRQDPHIWLNPVLAKKQVQNIAKALIELDPENKKYYEENSKNYISKLMQLNSKISAELSNCKKDFLAFHNAFSYFAKQYDLHQHTIVQNNEPHANPTPKNLEEIINLSQKLGIKVIFTEEGVDPRTSFVIADELGSKVLTLSPLEVVDENSSYISKMEENLSNLKEALCD